MKKNNVKEKNGMWKGNKVGYGALHAWIQRNMKVKKICNVCGSLEKLDVANISGKYKRDLSDWEYLCRKCHMTKDGRMIAILKHNKIKKLTENMCLNCKKMYMPINSKSKFCKNTCYFLYKIGKPNTIYA